MKRGNFGDLAINKGYISRFSLRMRETALFPFPVCSSTPNFLRGAKISAIRLPLRHARTITFELNDLRRKYLTQSLASIAVAVLR